MSFLLDALRKSESRKHARDVPTIHSPVPDGGRMDGRRGLVLAALIVLPAILVLAWFGTRGITGFRPLPDRVPAGAPAPSVAGPAMAERSVGGDPPARPGNTRPAPVLPLPGSSGARTPVEHYQAPASGPATSTTPEAAPDQVPALPPAAGAARIDPAPQPAVRQNHIGYWELPEDIRGQLPEFRVSVLVYADRPEDRFVLVNGQRQMEGDTVGPGLVLEEIRREGAIDSSRRYRFLVDRQGRIP